MNVYKAQSPFDLTIKTLDLAGDACQSQIQ